MGRKKAPGLNAETLRSVREEVGMSMAKLSEELGHHRSWCSRVESGKAEFSEGVARAVCSALGVSPTRFGLSEEESPKEFNPERLKELLEERGLSMRRLAALVGVSAVAAYRWNNGAQPAAPTVDLIAEALEVDPGELCRPAGKKEAAVTGHSGDGRWVYLSKDTLDFMGRALEAFQGAPLRSLNLETVEALRAALAAVAM